MPIIDKCAKCGRKGGYAADKDGELCARCEKNAGEQDANDSDQQT